MQQERAYQKLSEDIIRRFSEINHLDFGSILEVLSATGSLNELWDVGDASDFLHRLGVKEGPRDYPIESVKDYVQLLKEFLAEKPLDYRVNTCIDLFNAHPYQNNVFLEVCKGDMSLENFALAVAEQDDHRPRIDRVILADEVWKQFKKFPKVEAFLKSKYPKNC